jgi:hypothetical protein
VVDWANAAPGASSDAATIETARRLVIVSSMKLTMRFNNRIGGTFQHLPVPFGGPCRNCGKPEFHLGEGTTHTTKNAIRKARRHLRELPDILAL